MLYKAKHVVAQPHGAVGTQIRRSIVALSVINFFVVTPWCDDDQQRHHVVDVVKFVATVSLVDRGHRRSSTLGLETLSVL